METTTTGITDVTVWSAAETYVANGLPVLPLNGKIPATKNGSKDASLASSMIQFWHGAHPSANIGIATGHSFDDGSTLVVIDIDGEDGVDSFKQLEQTHGKIAETYTVRTANGGYHVYCRAPAGIVVRNRQGGRGEWWHVDVRGQGGYVVAPPSVVDGREYVRIRGSIDDIALLDDAWVSLLAAPVRSSARSGVSSIDRRVPEGARHDYLLGHAGSMRRRGMDGDAIYAALTVVNQKDCDPPDTDDEIRKIAYSTARLYEPEVDAPAQATTLVRAREVLTGLDSAIADDPGVVYSNEVVAAYITCLDLDQVAAGRAHAVMRKRRVPSRMFEAACAKFRREQREAAGLERIADPDGAPIKLRMPDNWRVTSEGVWFLGGENPEDQLVLPVPLYITRRLRVLDDDDAKVELAFQQRGGDADGEWKRVVCGRTTINTGQSITALGKSDLPVNSNTASRLVAYLHALEAANYDRIPVEDAISRPGWFGSSRFYPGASGDVSLEVPDWSDINARSFATNGSLEEWIAGVIPVMQSHHLLRMEIAASFAAPLLQPTGHRPFVLHLWSDSGGGKTASLVAAMSVWGSPHALMGNFNTTVVGLEHRMGLMNGLPVALNERQVVDKRIDQLIYMAAEGKGRTRGAKDGGLRRMAAWRMILLTNGEEPLIGTSSPEGMRTRVLEMEGSPIPDEDAARRLYDVCEASYGWAGRVYIAGLVDLMREHPGRIRSLHAEWLDALKHQFPDRIVSHLSAYALCLVADAMASQWVLGVEESEAFGSSLEFIQAVIEEQAPSREDGSEGMREEEFVWSLILRNRVRFEVEGRRHEGLEQWGFVKNGVCYVDPGVFDREATLSGHRTIPLKKRLANRGILLTEPNGDGARRLYRRVNKSRYMPLIMPEDVKNALQPNQPVT